MPKNRSCVFTPNLVCLCDVLDALLLVLATGLRLGELAALRWRDVDLTRAVLVIEGKAGRREIPLSTPVLNQLRARKDKLPVFSPDTIHRLRLTLRQFGCTAHSLRHLTVHHLLLRAPSLGDLAHQVGHAKVVTTEEVSGEAASSKESNPDQPTAQPRCNAADNPSRPRRRR